jgi:uncharacterized cupin superfamily protein
MTDYTHANMRTDVEDSAPGFGLAPDLEAHFARKPLGAERIGVSLQKLAPGARQAFGHRHTEDEEVYVVVKGGGRVKVDDEIVELGEWDAIRVAPSTMRCFEAGDDGIEYLAFGTHTEDDGETVNGWWSED